ncbi:QueT transporter family protein [Streptococcus ovuberis]|uniref:Queuosine transporter QueT n=1 Tax=Streptococcus ovuberis TaxID=1936207 RepID=A0A7X6MY37_9STRE|nr:QueT transporter family protein [Streptococcus ovuberis]NKZ20031.1 queuosine transporter QueT [Streptococcus ovuberis]
MKKWTPLDLAQIAMVAAIYIVLTLTPPLNAISFGAYQFRISEMMNFTAFYNKKYISGVTLGCMIANFIGYGWIDMVVGGASTLVFLTLGVFLFERYMKTYLFNGLINKAFFYFALFFSLSMFTIAWELNYLYQVPFFVTWLTTGLGEFGSLMVGAILMEKLSKHIDLR